MLVVDIVKVAVCVFPLESCTFTWKVNVPTELGVPDSRPEDPSVRPGGKEQESNDHVSDLTPSVAGSV